MVRMLMILNLPDEQESAGKLMRAELEDRGWLSVSKAGQLYQLQIEDEIQEPEEAMSIATTSVQAAAEKAGLRHWDAFCAPTTMEPAHLSSVSS